MNDSISTRAVKAIISNDNDEVLFLQRNPETRDTDNWDLPGGLIEDEPEKDALKREISEELDVEVEVGVKVGDWQFHRPLDGKTVKVSNYLCHIIKGSVSINQLSDEHIASRWVARTTVKELRVKDPSLFDALG